MVGRDTDDRAEDHNKLKNARCLSSTAPVVAYAQANPIFCLIRYLTVEGHLTVVDNTQSAPDVCANQNTALHLTIRNHWCANPHPPQAAVQA